MRVIAGTHRGRRLVAPKGHEVRPTSDRVRESMFNALVSLGFVDDAVVVDPFCGSGALGIEALSRGASHVTFIDRSRDALDACRANLADLDLLDDATVLHGDGIGLSVGLPEGSVDLALLDPPYEFDDWPRLLAAIPARWFVIESNREIPLPEGWGTIRSKRYGSTVVVIAERLTVAPNQPAPVLDEHMLDPKN